MSTAKKMLSFLETPTLNQKDYDQLAQIIFKLAGIHLPYNSKNIALMHNRLGKMLRKYQLIEYSDLVVFLNENIKQQHIVNEYISCLTTNKTDFYRESIHFDILLEEVKKCLKEKSEVFVWSSACSIGAEPYTMAIHLKEHLTPTEFERVKILATDIDISCLKSAAEGFYNSQQIECLNPNFISKYFDEVGNIFEIKKEIKNKVHFSQLNLFNYPFPISRKFDVIFCRNVLIYFTAEDRHKICTHLSNYLKPEGLLLLGLSETGSIQLNNLKLVSNSTYKKVGS